MTPSAINDLRSALPVNRFDQGQLLLIIDAIDFIRVLAHDGRHGLATRRGKLDDIG